MTHTTERPQRIELGNTGWSLRGEIPVAEFEVWWSLYDDKGAFIALMDGMRTENAQAFAAALNGMQPDVTGVWPHIKAPPRNPDAPPEWEDPDLPDFKIIFKVAREHGYSIGLHGSMKRDCDLIAVPWVASHSTPDALVNDLCKALDARRASKWEEKPMGRIAINLQQAGYYKLIDLSVMTDERATRAAARVRMQLDTSLKFAEVDIRQLKARIHDLEQALMKIANTGQTLMPDHWDFRCMARKEAHEALVAIPALTKAAQVGGV